MKKAITIFLLAIYSSTSFAITMDVHYCGGSFSGITMLNFGDAVRCGCNHTEWNHKGCCSDKIICAKTDSHKEVQQYWLSPDLLSFTLPDYFEKRPLKYICPVSAVSYYSSAGFTRSHSISFLTFLCTYRI